MAAATERTRLWKVTHNYVFRRIIKSFVTLFLVMILSFFMLRFMPGDPIKAYILRLTKQGVSHSAATAQASATLSFDPEGSIWKQLLEYMLGLFKGDLGTSLVSPGTPVESYVFGALPWTLLSVGVGTFIAFVLGITLGVIIAYRRNGILDHLITNVSSAIHAVPNYIWAMFLIVILGVRFEVVDITSMRGVLSPGVSPGWSSGFVWDALYHASLPILVYVATTVGTWTLTMKSATIQVLDEAYVDLARARGLRSPRILTQYIGRNAILPLFAQLAIALGTAVGGAVLVEQLFEYRGIGYLLFDSLVKRDYTVTQGCILVITAGIILANLVADLLLSRIDPRIRDEATVNA